MMNSFISGISLNNTYIVENELKKAAFLRIVTGLIIFTRFAEILVSQIRFYGFGSSAMLLAAFLLIILMFTFGFLTPLVNLLALLLIPTLDAKLSTNTLGSTIAVNLLVVQLLMNAGQYYSLDGKLLSKKNKIAEWLKKLYSIIGIPDESGIKKVYFLGFLLYAVSSLYALLLHAEDPYWVQGVTIRSMLTNSYLCKHAFFFRDLEAMLPGLLDIISVTGIIFQSVFQILMIPLIFFTAGKRFVKIWGFIFFFISLFFLSLSYLPHIELILWIILFCPAAAKNKIQILYDDKCNLCKRAMRLFKWTNINAAYEFIPVSKNRALYEKHSLSEVEVKTYMVGFYKEKLLKGYDLYMIIIAKNPVLFFLYPIFLLGKITKLGPYIYNAIAKNRYKLLGQCELSFDDELQRKNPPLGLRTGKSVTLIYWFYAVCIGLFVLTSNSFFEKFSATHPSIARTEKSYKKFTKFIGIEVPKVFNNTDLSMGDSFMTIKKRVGDKWVLLPVTGANGERLNYLGFDILLFSNHNSDLLYFGQTLRYRRSLISQLDDVTRFHEHGFGKRHIDFMIGYDRSLSGENSAEYKIEVFSSNASKVKLFEFNPERYSLVKIYEKLLIFNRKTGSDDRI